MKRNISYITLFSASLGLLAGCVSGRQAGKGISVTPVPYVLAPDSANRVRMDLCFHVPEDYLSKRSRLVITPQLVVEDTVRDEYLPLVVDASIYGKKKERMEKLSGYTDPYAGRAQQERHPARWSCLIMKPCSCLRGLTMPVSLRLYRPTDAVNVPEWTR